MIAIYKKLKFGSDSFKLIKNVHFFILQQVWSPSYVLPECWNEYCLRALQLMFHSLGHFRSHQMLELLILLCNVSTALYTRYISIKKNYAIVCIVLCSLLFRLLLFFPVSSFCLMVGIVGLVSLD